ncbi:hypothetical protein JX265_010592 [Neoarthrinium moseri]|uniref:Uncharacterized protein n=1 Tax=Neoarthrinium moseri TaxID=1658444 RepID=A0A9P9WEB3_9PEZI|nr:uncharacterized protein JN550_011127 [Neoarthrinium moseri]KAI1846215.1 hypothetical protein JX266_007740 [Neoarthrinium moseri]KAI1859115.1 hypothetical protein JX265_010592 [Neoarthrinium moseri]KAI1860972.1 hypothetical protein JN550_011127 [Neoarthrinium moseri]
MADQESCTKPPTHDLVNDDILLLCRIEGVNSPTDSDFAAITPEDEPLTADDKTRIWSIIAQQEASLEKPKIANKSPVATGNSADLSAN